MHNKTQYSLLALLLMIGLLPLGCGQTEYTGVLNHLYNACRDSDGIEYHPEDGSCFCPNGIVCEKGAVCDNTFNTCIEYKHEDILNCHDITNEYALADGSLILEGKCNDNSSLQPPEEVDSDVNNTAGEVDESNVKCSIKLLYSCSNNTICHDNTLYYYFNGKINTTVCPNGCNDSGTSCASLIDIDINTFVSKNPNVQTICAKTKNDANTKQYQRTSSGWKETVTCDNGCDITMQKCVIDMSVNKIQDQVILRYFDIITNTNETNHILREMICNTFNNKQCHDCKEKGTIKCENKSSFVCNEHGVWEEIKEGQLIFDEEKNEAKCVNIEDNSEQH